jgi:hypothetical protein
VLRLQLQGVKFLRLDQDIMALGMLVALDDFFFWNLFESLPHLNALWVFDWFSARLVDHAKGNGAFRRGNILTGTRTRERRRLPDQTGIGAMCRLLGNFGD